VGSSQLIPAKNFPQLPEKNKRSEMKQNLKKLEKLFYFTFKKIPPPFSMNYSA
jgi:hypothetical protein